MRGELAVAIRTFTVARRARRTSVSAAASSPTRDPAAEWAETELKAARLLAAAGADLPTPEVALTVSDR